MKSAEEYDKRSEDIADTARRFVVTLNGGAIALIVTLAAGLKEEGISPKWAYMPAYIFIIGLIFVGISLFLAKHKSIKRRDVVLLGKELPDYSKNYLIQSFNWDICSFISFALGSIYCLVSLSNAV